MEKGLKGRGFLVAECEAWKSERGPCVISGELELSFFKQGVSGSNLLHLFEG
jgi:hypothetical protein